MFQVEVKRAVKKEDMAAGMAYDQSYAMRTGKAPDWHCPDCKNKNFGWREVCNRCQVRGCLRHQWLLIGTSGLHYKLAAAAVRLMCD